MILLIDNYDSFSYNLYQQIGKFYSDIVVVRNDMITVEQIEKSNPYAIILSPGPNRPENAGICIQAIQKLHQKIPILGVCLGHQAIFEAFGGTVSYAKKIMHGKTSIIKIENKSKLFQHCNTTMQVARYHSLVAIKQTLPDVLRVTAETDDGEIMAIEHKTFPIYGVQFHPESVMTPEGDTIIQNFLEGITL
ncbi:MAG: aminodeoxychorismate/anthranilate synthase component II [Firmicutes bacterium]|nr:aminodeoxychorismate/anthranilate synthase component II [Bacillota bacterium]